MRLLKWILTVPIILLAVYSIQPAWFGPLSAYATRIPVAQVIALRGWMAIGFAGLSVGALVLSFIARIFGTPRHTRLLAAVFLCVALIHTATLFSRGMNNQDLTVAPKDGEFTVMQYNTEGGKLDFDQLADTIIANHVQAVSLVETSTRGGKDVVKKLRDRGEEFQLYDQGVSRWESDWRSSVLLINKKLGNYKPISFEGEGENAQRTLGARPVAGSTGPTFISVHPVAPVVKYMDSWRDEVKSAFQLCETYPDAIVLGDFNSTVDHQRILAPSTRCQDVGVQAGIGGLGTWPATYSSFLATPIDRVLTGGNYTGVAGTVLKNGGPDHRAIIIRIAPK